MPEAQVPRSSSLSPTAVAAAVLLAVSAGFSFALAAVLFARAGRREVEFGFISVGVARSVLRVWGAIAITAGLARLAAGIGVLARRSWAAVLGIVMAAVDAFVAFPGLGGRGTTFTVTELAVDVFVIWALVRHLRATPKEVQPGSTWSEFKADPQA